MWAQQGSVIGAHGVGLKPASRGLSARCRSHLCTSPAAQLTGSTMQVVLTVHFTAAHALMHCGRKSCMAAVRGQLGGA